MSSDNKQACPTCGQSVNKREISLYSGLVKALYEVWQYCERNDKWTLSMKTIRSELTQIDYSRFNDWKRFEPDMVTGSRGLYEFDKELMRQTFTGSREVCTLVLKEPLASYYERVEFKNINDVPFLKSFLDDSMDYIARYRGTAEIKQGRLL